MILARLTTAIRQQNWFAVGLEFVIVIAGVVIGFQVTEWSAARTAGERRAAALERLHDEAEQIVAFYRERVELHESINALRTEAIERLMANDWEDANRSDMTQGINSVGILPAANPPRSVYDELISAGEFAEIGSPDVRNAISAYYASLTFLQDQIDYVRDRIEDPVIVGQPGVRIVYVPGDGRQRRWVFDFQVLSQDETFVQRLLVGNNSQRAVTSWTRGTLDMAELMCARIGEATGRPCNPERETAP